MTIKYDDLENFIKTLKRLGYHKEVSNNVLETQIAKRFGLSPYIMGNIKKQLVKFGFISGDGVVWIIKYGVTEENKPIEVVEKEAEKELEDYEYLIG